MRFRFFIAFSLLSLAATAAPVQGATFEKIQSRLLNRTVELALHVPSDAAVKQWKAAHPEWKPRLVLFLVGAYDGPTDPIRKGLFADLTQREDAGDLAPALWATPESFTAWYADRKDGSFPYERFLMEELLPDLERRFPAYGGSRETRTVAGFSMGGFGALNLSAHTRAFGRCAALSPAFAETPFKGVGFLLRGGLKRTFPLDAEGFAHWDPWVNLGGDADLVLGCGTEDKYHLDAATRGFAKKCQAQGRPVAGLFLSPGGHDWKYWTPAFERLAPWIAGSALPTTLEP